MKRRRLSIIIVVLAMLALGGTATLFLLGAPMDKEDKEILLVRVEPGSGTGHIASSLKEKDLIRSESYFKFRSKVGGYDGQYKAGTYAFSRSMSVEEMMIAIRDGDTAGKTFRIIEGMTIDKVADQLEAEGIVSRTDFYREVEEGEFDYPFMKYLPEGPTRLEGFLYPNTYEVPVDATAHEVVDTMLRGFNDAVGDEYYKEAKKQGKDIYQVIIVASIVEREAARKDEKPKVASVIYNRLEIDMPLQMDSIISYIHKEDKIRATYSDIAVESPYNPYTNKGLPPGPICAPGIDAVRAALYPDDTEYLYFVAKPEMDGSNVYSETYEEFLKDKAAFDKAYEKYIKENPGER